MRALLVCCVCAVGCGHVQPVSVPPAPVTVQAPTKVAPVQMRDVPSTVIAALLAVAGDADEVEAVVAGRRYACLRRPLQEHAAGALDAATLWSTYVRDLSQAPAGTTLTFEVR